MSVYEAVMFGSFKKGAFGVSFFCPEAGRGILHSPVNKTSRQLKEGVER
jgi:hypothetical protein